MLIEDAGLPFTLALKVVAEGKKVMEPQLLTKFWALTEPRPVARSYAAVAGNAGVEGLVVSTRTPFAPATLLLQLGVPKAQGTELFPLVTSLKVQVDAGGVLPLELQEAPGPSANA